MFFFPALILQEYVGQCISLEFLEKRSLQKSESLILYLQNVASFLAWRKEDMFPPFLISKKGTRKPHVAIICLDFDLNLISPLLFFHSPYLYKYPLARASPRKVIGSEPLRTDKRSSSWRESTVFNDTKVEVGWHSCTGLTAMADVLKWADGIKRTQHIYQMFCV